MQRVQILVRASVADKARFKAAAEEAGLSLNEWILRTLHRFSDQLPYEPAHYREPSKKTFKPDFK